MTEPVNMGRTEQTQAPKKYPPRAAANRITDRVPTAGPEETIRQIKEKLYEKANIFETISYIYVLDSNGCLLGLFSTKELFKTGDSVKAEEIMNTNIIKARPYTDQEEVALLALKYNLKSIPIVDKNNKFMGVVRSRAIMNILQGEHVEDFLKSAGIRGFAAKNLSASASQMIKARVMWLIVGLFGGVLAAHLTGLFEEPLKQYFILAAFVPLMVYMADAIGTQTQTLFVRDLVMRQLVLKKYLLREIKVGFGIAALLGLLLYIITIFWSKNYFIALILGLSMFLTGFVAIFVPIAIILILNKLGLDPAIGSGPFATIIQDVLTLAIYFAIASTMLNLMPMN
ncbi:MAG: magnesium transporter [Candidatus Diapherotrites archaeon]|nr:magnesium transporter [Candidatus Diapherotrites archaeon]